MRYAIIENEEFALQHLKMMVDNLRPDYSLVFTAESVEDVWNTFLRSLRSTSSSWMLN